MRNIIVDTERSPPDWTRASSCRRSQASLKATLIARPHLAKVGCPTSSTSPLACAEHRGRSTRSEWPRYRKINHPRPRRMDTSRVDGVKASLHNGTPRSHSQSVHVIREFRLQTTEGIPQSLLPGPPQLRKFGIAGVVGALHAVDLLFQDIPLSL